MYYSRKKWIRTFYLFPVYMKYTEHTEGKSLELVFVMSFVMFIHTKVSVQCIIKPFLSLNLAKDLLGR